MNFLSLKQKAFGLDISDLSLKIINFKKRGRGFELASFGQEAINEGIIEDGQVIDEKSLGLVVKKALSSIKGHRLDTKYAIVSLPEEKSFLQAISLPKMDKEELEQAAKFEAENYIPMPSDQMYIDFEVTRPLEGNQDHLDVLIGAAPKNIVDSYVSAIKAAGLIPLAMEIESQAISRALIKGYVSKDPILLIDLGATRTSFIIYSGDAARFTASIPVTSHQFTNVISEKIGVDAKKAEELKINYGLESRNKVSFKKKIQGAEFEKEISEDKRILDALAPSIMNLTKEIRKYLNYYQTHKSHEHLPEESKKSVKEILLCGGGANLKGLARVLSLELELPVSVANPWINALYASGKVIKNLNAQESLSYTTAIGLALRGVNE